MTDHPAPTDEEIIRAIGEALARAAVFGNSHQEAACAALAAALEEKP